MHLPPVLLAKLYIITIITIAYTLPKEFVNVLLCSLAQTVDFNYYFIIAWNMIASLVAF